MKRWAMIDSGTNIVMNICNWDGDSKWNPPVGIFLIESQLANNGDIYDPQSGIFSPGIVENTEG